MTALQASASTFKEVYMTSGSTLDAAQTFEQYPARLLRYELLWGFFENDAYRNIHRWSQQMRIEYGLYKHIRGIYNPAYRLGRFWSAHLLGGSLDLDAGAKNSALPIKTDHDAIRPALSQLWRSSNWQFKKDLFTLRGVVLGDVGLRIIDDPDRQKVTIDVVHPSAIRDVVLDSAGNVKEYVLSELRTDPRPGKEENAPAVTFTERASRSDSGSVLYQTYLDGELYGWNEQPEEWEEGYGFIPFVMVQHFNIGKPFGWSEYHTGLAKIREADDLGSKLDDQIRKLVDSPWLLSGVKKPDATPKTTGSTSTQDEPEPDREEIPIIYAPVGAAATPLVAPLDIAATSAQIKSLIEEIERDYPELLIDRMNAAGAASGRAIRLAREATETKAQAIRSVYDDAAVRIGQMGLAIGGFRGYAGYAGFGLDSFQRGDLAFSIDARPVFANDPQDDLELDKAFWEAANAAKTSGYPLDLYLARQGWTDKEIAEYKASPEYQSALAVADMRQAALDQQRSLNVGG